MSKNFVVKLPPVFSFSNYWICEKILKKKISNWLATQSSQILSSNFTINIPQKSVKTMVTLKCLQLWFKACPSLNMTQILSLELLIAQTETCWESTNILHSPPWKQLRNHKNLLISQKQQFISNQTLGKEDAIVLSPL